MGAYYTVSTKLKVTYSQPVATMQDRAAVNKVALRTLRIVFSNILDVVCCSHTLDRVREKFITPILDVFVRGWISLFSRSPKTGLAWKTKTGLSVPTYSTTQWWSKWKVMKNMHDAFGLFLQDASLPPTRLKLLEILNDLAKCRKLQIELAITIDADEPLVKSTYRLEGDGPLVFAAFEEITALRGVLSTEFYLNT